MVRSGSCTQGLSTRPDRIAINLSDQELIITTQKVTTNLEYDIDILTSTALTFTLQALDRPFLYNSIYFNMATTSDALAIPDLEKSEGGGTQLNTGHDDENSVPVKDESSHGSDSKPTDSSDKSPKASEDLDPVRTLRGFKVRSPGEGISSMTRN